MLIILIIYIFKLKKSIYDFLYFYKYLNKNVKNKKLKLYLIITNKMKHYSKQTKFIITFIILSLVAAIFLYIALKSKNTEVVENYRHQSLSQPTVTNPNPIVNDYFRGYPYENPTSYFQPYKKPLFAKYIPNSPNLSATDEIISNGSKYNTELFRYQMNKEQMQPVISELPSGQYIIKNKNTGIVLNSTSCTPVQCNNFIYNPSMTSSKDEGWNLHLVSKGIYIFKKPNNKECLYAGLADKLKSYQLEPSCSKKTNVCGLESLNYEKKLDPESKRTYFEVWQYPEGFAIRNVENQKFVCLINNEISFVDTISPECLFTITPQ